MIVLQKQSPSNEEAHIVVLFGTGLIGSAVYNAIIKLTGYSAYFFPFSWNSLEQSQKDIKSISSYLVNLITSHSRSNNIAFVWCAGKAGFGASQKEMSEELVNFETVLKLVREVEEQSPLSRMFFHHFSSAGGLYEGQLLIDKQSPIEPRRSYGFAKHDQEKHLLELDGKITKRIYRPSSVYGYVVQGHRKGLIPTLILNGLQNRVSTIIGGLSTLRDYIFSNDVGLFVAKKMFLACESSQPEIHFLGSGKPSSIYEVKHIVEQEIGRKIHLRFQTTSEKENAMNITINTSTLPSDWMATDLSLGIRYVKEQLIMGRIFYAPLQEQVCYKSP